VRRYALLLTPGANRVYGRSAPALGRAELAVLNEFGLGGRLSDLGEERLGGVTYLTFASSALESDDIAVLSNLSGLFAVFERDGSDLLRPLDLAPLDRWDDDLITIQRYGGKTNEQFTKLLVNLAVVVGHGGDGLRLARPELRIVDPLCGRGTTLNQAVMYGFDAAGIDNDRRDIDAYLTFFATWLKNKRIKHHVERQKLRTTITMAATKAEQSQALGQRVVVIADDTNRAVDHLGRNSADAIVADLPYGVQHGSRVGAGLSRRPLDLLTGALPVWRALLKPGSAMVLAWNTRTMERDAFRGALVDAGFEPVGADDGRFSHQVDSAITRDLMIARRAV
jgi:SAM-dependent methyltransferase